MGLSGGLSANGQGAFSTVIDKSGVLMPVAAGGHATPTSTGAIGTAFKAFFMRAVVPQSGVLHDISVYNGATVAGNTNVAVLDCGDALAGSYSPLWSSGSVAAAGVNAWQVIGDPALPVKAGQNVMLAVMNDGTTHVFGQNVGAIAAAASQLPPNFMPWPGGASPKLSFAFTYGSLAYSAVAEASALLASAVYSVIGRIA